MLHPKKQILFTCLLLSTVFLNTGYRISMCIRCRDFGKCSLEKESLYHLPQMASLFALGACRHQRCGEPWGTPCSHFGIWPVQKCSDFEILLFSYDFYLQHKNLSISLLVFLLLNVCCFLVGLGCNKQVPLHRNLRQASLVETDTQRVTGSETSRRNYVSCPQGAPDRQDQMISDTG